jgi:23S rRNA (cytosine1962-C5)-methyltransferase
MRQLRIKKGKEASLLRFHPWVFSGALVHLDTIPENGEVVAVTSHTGQVLGTAHYSVGTSIALRVFVFGKAVVPDRAFWKERLGQAFAQRQQLGLPNAETNAFRLIHGEGDGLPGLILDIYGTVAVIQAHSIGMHLHREDMAAVLMEIIPGLTAVYDKSAESMHGASVANGLLIGTLPENHTVLENGFLFPVDVEKGQKTGFFLDQRDNRALLSRYTKGKKVLNAFSYTGGFSVYALQAGATEVDSVDVSRKAIDACEVTIAANNPTKGKHNAICEDVLTFLKNPMTDYDVWVIDPPAFAKNINKRHNAVQGYRRLNQLVLEAAPVGALIFTFSCSQVVDRQLFYDTIVAAAIDAKRTVQVLHHLSQPADHPVSIHHPEGSYLKGLVIRVLNAE